jgi:hypothetical protein
VDLLAALVSYGPQKGELTQFNNTISSKRPMGGRRLGAGRRLVPPTEPPAFHNINFCKIGAPRGLNSRPWVSCE